MTANLRLDYITGQDPANTGTWSGLNAYIKRALERQGLALHPVFGFKAKPSAAMKFLWHWHQRIGKNYQYERTACYARQYAGQASARLNPGSEAVLSTISSVIPFLQTNLPIALYTDATFANLTEYYDHFSNLSRLSRLEGDRLEKLAFDRCDHLFFASQWAADSAVNYYAVDPSKVSVVPFGANLPEYPTTQQAGELIKSKTLSIPTFLFVGVEFERKGGRLAVALVEEFLRRGINARLVMVGMRNLDEYRLPSFVEDAGFLDKSNPADWQRLKQYFETAHFFLLPSQRECFGVVYAEASAFGLPSIALNTGGVGTALRHAVNGLLFEPGIHAGDLAAYLLPLLMDDAAYKAMCHNARRRFDEELNWDVAGKSLADTIYRITRP